MCRRGTSGVCWAHSLSAFADELAAQSHSVKGLRQWPQHINQGKIMPAEMSCQEDHGRQAYVYARMYIIFNPFACLLAVIAMPHVAYAHVYMV